MKELAFFDANLTFFSYREKRVEISREISGNFSMQSFIRRGIFRRLSISSRESAPILRNYGAVCGGWRENLLRSFRFLFSPRRLHESDLTAKSFFALFSAEFRLSTRRRSPLRICGFRSLRGARRVPQSAYSIRTFCRRKKQTVSPSAGVSSANQNAAAYKTHNLCGSRAEKPRFFRQDMRNQPIGTRPCFYHIRKASVQAQNIPPFSGRPA